MRMRQLKIGRRFTPREERTLDLYLWDVERIGLLRPEEEAELAQRARNGDGPALERLVRGNLRFVVSVAKQYTNLGLPLPDLVSEGNLGLIKAAQRFDPSRGFKFISYAVWWVRQGILQALAEKGHTVRLPLHRVQQRRRLLATFARLEQDHGREPTAEEISVNEGIDPAVVHRVLEGGRPCLSLDSPAADDGPTPIELLPSSHPDASTLAEQASMRGSIGQALHRLPTRQREVLLLHYGLEGRHPHTLAAIAEHLEMSRERVRQIKESAFRSLRKPGMFPQELLEKP